MQRGIERNDCASRSNDPQICSHPARMIVRHNRKPRSRRESVFTNPSPHRLRHPAHFGVGATLKTVMTLDLKRNLVGPALLALDKAVVKSGHEWCGIYTKNLFTADHAKIAGNNELFAPFVSAFTTVRDFCR